MPRLSKIGAAALAAFGWTSGTSAVSASYLVVAGGAGGGKRIGAGGGAGGYRTGTASLNPTLSYTVTVGAGGAGSGVYSSIGSSGSDSVFNAITSTGGGGGDSSNPSKGGGSGGSGGGSADGGTVGSGNTPSTSPSQGNNGGVGSGNSPNYGSGGGGGASAVGGNGSATVAGNGGAGTASSISGSSVTYAGGGGGGSYGGTAGSGGAGGGGAGTTSDSTATAGTANLGGGGGGCGGISNSSGTTFGGQGGSGVVIISYAGAQQFSGGVVTSSGGNTIHTFTTSGTLGPVTPLSANYLVVAGGGSGGGGYFAGGGGAGGLLSGSSLTIDPYSTYLVTVGAGAAAVSGNSTNGLQGSNSAFSMVATAAVGGGYGAGYGGSGVVGGVGGSGGGTAANALATVAAGTSGQGNAGGQSSNNGGGGGGGAGSVGGNAGASFGIGGTGSASSISGASVTYAAGAAGGITGVGNGASGTANTGNGGAASSASGGTSGAGGSGVVIISYAGSTQLMAGGVVTIAGGNVIHTFNSSGYLTPLTLLTRSLRFRSSASAYLNRTPATAGNRRTWTYSTWVKLGSLSTTLNLLYAYSADTDSGLCQLSYQSNQLRIQGISASFVMVSTAVYRDPSAWYHVVYSVDTTQATAANRVRVYVNGVEITAWSTNTPPPQNTDTAINNNVAHNIGRNTRNSNDYFDGYLAEVNFIDGQALAPTAFGTFNSYGVWQPITYGGSYGTNGFYLPFSATAPTGTPAVSASYLVVAGGAGGGQGGGGAGGLLSGTTSLPTTSSYAVTVGAGGAATTYVSGAGVNGINGSNSVFNALTSIGGGGGGAGQAGSYNGSSGGSGGGAGSTYSTANSGGAGTSGQGNAGGNATAGAVDYVTGGGGGAGAVGGSRSGNTSGSGGAGTASSISGSSVTYAGGGGGGSRTPQGTSPGSGGSGGGGAGSGTGTGTSGTANTGGGGGGACQSGGGNPANCTSGAGGSGVVIISYAGAQKFTGGTVTTSGSNTIHTFTTSGVLTYNLGTDFSPQGNNWTTNNISTTSGSTYDSMTDVPTLTSATAANYCVFNPLDADTSALSVALTNGNLTASGTTYAVSLYSCTFQVPTSGKWYYEFVYSSLTSVAVVGIRSYATGSTDVQYLSNGNKIVAGATTAYGSTWTTGDTMGVAVNRDAGTITFYKNNTSQGVITIPTNTAAFDMAWNSLAPYGTASVSVNFGQQPWTYTPPSGFVAINTFNM